MTRVDKTNLIASNAAVQKVKNDKPQKTSIFNALAEVSKDKGIDQTIINYFKKVCIDRELDAWFYTDEKVIMKEIKKMLNMINK